MSSQPKRPPVSPSKLIAGLAVVSALGGLFSAAVFLGLGATLALDGTGRYRVLANLAWGGVALAVVVAVLMLWLAWQGWRRLGAQVGWRRWLVFLQTVLLLLALVAVAYGNLRAVLYGPPVVGLLSTLALWLSLRSEQ